MQKKIEKVLPDKKKVVLLQSQNERNGAREKREVLGSSLKEWNDVANGSKRLLRDSQAIKSGQTKKKRN